MTMRSVGWALSWEYWRRGMLWLVPGAVGVTVSCLALLYWGISGYISDPISVSADLQRALLPFVLWPPVVLAIASWEVPRRTYTLPVSTARLVAWSLANGAVATGAMSLSIALLVNALFRADWPLIGPTLYSAVAYLTIQAATWWLGRSRTAFFLVLIVLGSVVASQQPRFVSWLSPASWQTSPLAWAQHTAGSLGCVLVLAALAYLFALNGIARDRRGNAWSLAWIGRWWRARGEGRRGWSPWRREDAGSYLDIYFLDIYFAEQAQAWLEWRTKGRHLPLSTAGLLAGMWFCFAIFRVEPADVSGALAGLSMMFVVGAPFLGLLMGSSSGGFDLKPFAATRPMSDGDLASSVLRNAAVSFGIAAAIWLPGLLVTSIVWQHDEWQAVLQDLQGWETCEGMITVAVVLTLASWTLLGLGTALAMAGCRFVLWGGLGAGALGLSVIVGLSNGPGDRSGDCAAGSGGPVSVRYGGGLPGRQTTKSVVRPNSVRLRPRLRPAAGHHQLVLPGGRCQSI